MKIYTTFLFLFLAFTVNAQKQYTAEQIDSALNTVQKQQNVVNDCLVFVKTIENVTYSITGVYGNVHDAGHTTITKKMEYKDFPLELTQNDKKTLVVKANGRIELYFKIDYIGEDGILIKSDTFIGNQFVKDLEYMENAKIVLGIFTHSKK